MTRWRLLLDPSAGGPWNMGVDEALLASAQRSGVASLRFYTWAGPWLSLGYGQRLSAQQRVACRRAGIGWVRRVTGGRAVLHGSDLTYSLAAPLGLLPLGLQGSYERITEALSAALASLGVPARRSARELRRPAADEFDCFAGTASADLRIRGRKLSGSAQRRVAGALLQHGSLRLSESAPSVVAAGLPFGERQCATSLAREGFPVSLDELRRACCGALAEALQARFEETGLEEAEARRARARGLEPSSKAFSRAPWSATERPQARYP